MPTDGRRRGRGYDEDDDGYERYGGAEGADDLGPRGYDDDAPNEAPGWAERRGQRTPPRRSRDRGAPPLDDADEGMIARRDESRPGSPRRRGGPEQAVPPWDDFNNPLDDPRAPLGLREPSRSGPSRQPRTPGSSGSSRGRGSSRYESDPRRGSGRYDPPGSTDEEPAARYGGYGGDEPEGYSEEYEARPRYPDERRGPPSGARGPRSVPGAGRAMGRGRDGALDAYEAYDEREEFGRPGAYGRTPARAERDPRDMGGYGDRYADADMGRGYPSMSRGGHMARGPRDAFDASSVWEPAGGPYGGAPGVEERWASARGASADKPPAKQRNGILPIAFRLLTVVIIVVGLVTVVGSEFAPKLGKYLPFLANSAQATPPPTFATYTPGPTPTTLPNYKLFTSATQGYAMDYPSSWGTATVSGAGGSQGDSVDQFRQGSGPAVMSVERAPAFDSATDAQLILAEVQGAEAQGATLTEITGAATTEGVGGEVWQRHEYKATAKSGAKLHIAVLACHHLGKGYVIALISSDTSFAKDDTATFEPMLRTFRFL